MEPVPKDTLDVANRGARRWILAMLAGLLLLGCCLITGLGAWLFAPFTSFMANRLSYVHGKAELIAPAQWHPGGIMSPDGRYIVMGWAKNGPHEQFVWDLATDAQYPFNLGGGGLCWLNPDQFVVRDTSTETYYLVQAQHAVIVPATWIKPKDQYPEPDGLTQLHLRWQAAEQRYVMENFGVSGYTVVTFEQERPYVYRNFGTGRDSVRIVTELMRDLPHIRIRERCSSVPQVAQLYSPDGRFYTQRSTGNNAHVLIYTREGELVAEAYKDGWTPRLMGWSYDSNAVYFEMLISGGAASVLMPDAPIFKLSPITPEEQRWLIAQRVGLGVGIVAALMGALWWWRRRRRESR